jgi:hypothetical protein
MLLNLLSLYLTFIGVESAKLCPDKEVAFIKCNQNTKICEHDSNLVCHPIKGTYYCCGGPITANSSPWNITFIPEIQHQEIASTTEENSSS